MKTFSRQSAMQLARTARQTVDFSRWLPNLAESTALVDLERALSVSVQSGQPELEAMQDRMVASCAAALSDLAQTAYRGGRISQPTLLEEQLFGGERVRVADVIDVRQPATKIVDVSYLRRDREAAALAA